MDSGPDDKTEMRRAPSGATARERSLPIGTLVAEFEIVGIVGGGGFGIVYLAYDHSLHRRVALKEYMPAALAERVPGMTDVRVSAPEHLEAFSTGLGSFVNEARVLAQLDHPSLVKVYRFWEQNGTAYMVMPYYTGITLKQWLQDRTAPPDEDALLRLLVPLLDALDVIHAARIYHRDIAPDNILIVAGGRPVLLDFGAARQVLSDRTEDLTTILKPGYAPIEQYSGQSGARQGAYTDLYALGALMYLAISGEKPPPSVSRLVRDTLVPASMAGAGRYSPTFLAAIDRCLEIHHERRPQSVQQLRELLGIGVDVPTIIVSPVERDDATATQEAGSSRRRNAAVLGAVFIVLALAGAAAWRYLPEPPVPSARREPAVAPVAADAVPQRPAVGTESPLAILESLFQLRDPGKAVEVEVEKSRVRIGVDKPSFRVTSPGGGFLYVFRVGTDAGDLAMLFPNAIDHDNRIGAGQPLTLPRKGWHFVADGVPGTNHLLALVSATPRDHQDAGVKRGDPFDEFPLAALHDLARAEGGYAFFAGKPACPGEPCDHGFGAARFAIEQVE